MSFSSRIILIVVWVVSLVAAGVMTHAQAPSQPPLRAQAPTVLSGSDVGFRVDGRKGSAAVGVLVVRINGQWVETEFGVGIRRLTAK